MGLEDNVSIVSTISIPDRCCFIFYTGGCGAMYQIEIESEDFRGMKTVKQHMMVTDVSHIL